jgi:hypothetical protein
MKNASKQHPVRRKKAEPTAAVASMTKTIRSHRQEATIISGGTEELKDFIVQHLAMPLKPEKVGKSASPADRNGDLFRQVVSPAGGELPAEAKLFETYVLREKKKDRR